MLSEQRQKVVRFDMDSEVLSAVVPDVFVTSGLQRLNTSSDSTEDEEVRAAARAFTEKTTLVLDCRRAAAWEVSPELDET